MVLYPEASEGRATTLAMLAAALTIAHQVAAKSLRDGLFLATFSVADLPKAMLCSALSALPVALLAARGMARFGPARFAPALFVLSALSSVLECLLLARAPRVVAVVLYLHISIGGALLISAFWSIVNERFDPHTLKRLVVRVGASATFGGLVGGAVMERAARYLDARGALLLLCALSLSTALVSARLGATVAQTNATPQPTSGQAPLSRYLWTLALLVASSAAVSALGDFALKQAAASRFTSVASLVRFFALFYTGASLLSFVVQITLTERLLGSVGIGGTLLIQPLAGLALGTASLFVPSIASIAALRGSDLTLGPSLFRSAFEPLFTPVPPALKRRAKALIDVVFDKCGDAIASLLILSIIARGPAWLARGPLFLACIGSAVTALLCLSARKGYVSALEASLRAGTLNLSDRERETNQRLGMSATALGMSGFQFTQGFTPVPQSPAPPARSNPPTGPALIAANERLSRDVQALIGGDELAAGLVLARSGLDPRLTAFIIPYLALDSRAKLAVSALQNLGEPITGALADALLSSTVSLAVQRRIPYVLRSIGGASAARALTLGLSARFVEVRYRCALSLRELAARDSTLAPDPSQIEMLVLRELAVSPLPRPSLDHVFSLLALTLTSTVLELVRQGVLSDDRKLRGTALEYLASLLPETLQSPLISALLHDSELRRNTPRSPEELARELQHSLRVKVAAPSLAADPE